MARVGASTSFAPGYLRYDDKNQKNYFELNSRRSIDILNATKREREKRRRNERRRGKEEEKFPGILRFRIIRDVSESANRKSPFGFCTIRERLLPSATVDRLHKSQNREGSTGFWHRDNRLYAAISASVATFGEVISMIVGRRSISVVLARAVQSVVRLPHQEAADLYFVLLFGLFRAVGSPKNTREITPSEPQREREIEYERVLQPRMQTLERR